MSSHDTDLCQEIIREVRAIFRLRDDLRSPITSFTKFERRDGNGPSFYIDFDSRPHMLITGLQIGMKLFALPDERIQDLTLEACKAVWHLKDRLKMMATANGSGIDVETLAAKSDSLLLCADLANRKKHGENKNRSTKDPRCGLVKFHFADCGVIELYYDGATGHKEVIVERPVPIHFHVTIASGDDTELYEDAVTLIEDALRAWTPTIYSLNFLEADDRSASHIRSLLDSLSST